MRSFAWTLLLFLTSFATTTGFGVADEETGQVAGSDELKSDSHQAVVDQMRRILKGINLVRLRSQPVIEELVPEPVLNWDDLVRGHHHGTLWVWGSKGRPAAILEMYTSGFSQKLDGWPGNVAHSLAPEPLRSEGGLGWNWTPDSPGVVPVRLADVPLPGATTLLRRLQMRSLAKRFTSHEVWQGDRAELRLLPAPIRLYDSTTDGILEGGLFALVHGGSNPEVILLIEAVQNRQDRFWQFGCARLGHAEIHVNFDDKPAWNAETYKGTSAKSPYYWLAKDR